MPTDNHSHWNGVDYYHTLQLDAEGRAVADLERAIDELYG